EHTWLPMASLTRCTMMARAAFRSWAAFTSWTILRSVFSISMAVSLSVPHRQARGQFLQGAAVDLTLEGDHLAEGIPVTDPAPAIEFRLAGQIHAYPGVIAEQAQQEPLLLLADAQRLAVGAHQALRQPVAQPAPGAGQDAHVVGIMADLLVQLAIQGLLGGLIGIDAPLGKLPGVLVDAARPEYLPDIVGQDDADIGAETIGVDHGGSPHKTRGRHCSTKTDGPESEA